MMNKAGATRDYDMGGNGICGVVRCADCSLFLGGECGGCRALDPRACSIIACAGKRSVDTCITCREFPCEIFPDEGSRYIHPAGIASCSSDRAISPSQISHALLARLAGYLTAIDGVMRKGQDLITSNDLASMLDVKPPLVRKDLSSLGSFGKRRVGYDTRSLFIRLKNVLNIGSNRNIIWVGTGLCLDPVKASDCLRRYGCMVILATSRRRINKEVLKRFGHIPVFKYSIIERIIANLRPSGAVIATEEDMAEETANDLYRLGLRFFLNLTPAAPRLPFDAYLRSINIQDDLLAFSLSLRAGDGARV